MASLIDILEIPLPTWNKRDKAYGLNSVLNGPSVAKSLSVNIDKLNISKKNLPFLKDGEFRKYVSFANSVDLSAAVKDFLRRSNAQSKPITNGELKMNEILHDYTDCLLTTKPNLKYFAVAEFPGFFIQAVLKFTDRSKRQQHVDWLAQSYEPKDESKGALKADEAFFGRNREKWLIWDNTRDPDDPKDKGINGDLTDPSVLAWYADFFSDLEDKVDLVTADGGMPVNTLDPEKGYSRQEQLHYKLIIGQILAALQSLKRGGSFVLKIFSITTRTTVSFLLLLRLCFGEVKVIKPKTSRMRNDENYVLCCGFEGSGKKIVAKVIDTFGEFLDHLLTTDRDEEDWFPFTEPQKTQVKEILNWVKSRIIVQITFLDRLRILKDDNDRHKKAISEIKIEAAHYVDDYNLR